MARDEPRWHPIMAAVEAPVGTWRMVDSQGREYGLVRLVRVGGEPMYRAELAGEHLGYGNSLRVACERVHHEFIRAHAPPGRQAAGYPIRTPDTTTPPPPTQARAQP